MFKSLSSFALLAAIATQQASSQMTSQAALSTGIATVMLNLQGAQVIPQLLSADSFKLSALLQQTFGSTSNNPGQSLSIAQVTGAPTLALQYNSAEQSSIENASYTVMTLDPGAATATAGNVVRHYLANNVTLSNGQLQNTTQAIAGWFSPAPPAGSGVHRYTTLVFSQPSNFNLPDSLSHFDGTINTDFDLTSYISQTKLGSVIAATFFLCSNSSTAASSSVQPVPTTAVGSSAIQAAAATVSVSAQICQFCVTRNVLISFSTCSHLSLLPMEPLQLVGQPLPQVAQVVLAHCTVLPLLPCSSLAFALEVPSYFKKLD